MDISEATTLAAAIVALIASALIQTFKQYILDGYTTLTSLAVSLLLGVIAIVATGGFTGYGWASSLPQLSASPKPYTHSASSSDRCNT